MPRLQRESRGETWRCPPQSVFRCFWNLQGIRIQPRSHTQASRKSQTDRQTDTLPPAGQRGSLQAGLQQGWSPLAKGSETDRHLNSSPNCKKNISRITSQKGLEEIKAAGSGLSSLGGLLCKHGRTAQLAENCRDGNSRETGEEPQEKTHQEKPTRGLVPGDKKPQENQKPEGHPEMREKVRDTLKM